VVAGYAGVQCVLDEGYITNVAVDTAFRGRGIATRLLTALDEMARARGLTFLTLEVRASNQAAIALYETCGYQKAGVRRGFYTKPREDAILYTKHYN
jgi:ribosomal-protein-alanine N-acetyltransferase